MTPPGPQRPLHHPLWFRALLALAAILLAAYVALPAGWGHYEHRKGLQGREMITRTRQGIPGDPINVGLVGSEADVFCAFQAAGWLPATPVTLASSLKIVDSVAFRRSYPTAPVSALYYDGRPEDLAFEQAGGPSAETRHHVRFWKVATAPDEAGDPRPLWLGSSSFDKGVGVSHYTFRVTHHIDADLDAERTHLTQALAATGRIKELYEVSGVGPTLSGRNGGGDRYFTDGEAVVETLNPACSALPSRPPKRLPNPWLVEMKNGVWARLRPLIRALP